MTKLNNARIQAFGYFAVHNHKLFDEKLGIWRGETIMNSATQPEFRTIFFLRKYDRVNNDIDRMLQGDFEIKNADIFGAPVLLVPKEKVLFAYEPPSLIEKPPMKIVRGGM